MSRIDEIKARRATNVGVHEDMPQDIDFLLAEVEWLRQGLWDCAKYAGADLDGDETPRAFVGDLVPYVVGIIKEQRGEYDELLNELPLSKSESEL